MRCFKVNGQHLGDSKDGLAYEYFDILLSMYISYG